MDQEPLEAPPEPEGGKPKLFQNVNAVIAGVTGLVVALGGLAAATKDMWGNKEAEKPSVVTRANTPASDQSQQAAVSTEQPQAARPTVYKGKLYDKETEAYDGSTVLLTYNGKRWILSADGVDYPYDEVVSGDKSQVIARSVEYTSKLRWPVEGGVMKESTASGTDDWDYYAEIKPVSPSAAD